MKVTITEINSLQDALMAAGLSRWLEGIDGVDVKAPSGIDGEIESMLAPAPAPVAAVGPVSHLDRKRGRPAKKKTAPTPPQSRRKAVKAAKPVKAKKSVAAPEAPRVTIRSRILEILKGGTHTAVQMAVALRAQGVETDAHLAGQHMYLATRDGFARRDGEGWRLAA